MISRRARAFGALPQVLADVAEAGGLALAAAFAQAFGGRRVYVPLPENLAESHPVARAVTAGGLTFDDARRLADTVGGMWVDVPFGPFAGGARRRAAASKAAVVERLRAGETKSSVAQALDMTERRVYQIQADSGDVGAEDESPPPLLAHLA